MFNPDQLLARLYALRKDYDDDREDVSFACLDAAFMFVSYNMSEFRKFVEANNAKKAGDE